MKIAHPALQWRALVKRAGATQHEARVRRADTGGNQPNGSLRGLREVRLVLRSGERIAPKACSMGLKKRPCCSHVGRNTSEFKLEYFRIPHRRGGSQLSSASIGQFDEFVQSALGDGY